MIDNTPNRVGKRRDYKEGDSPQSDNSDNTAATAVTSASTLCEESNRTTCSTLTLEELQEDLPEEIKTKTYPSSKSLSAEDELFEDLKSHSLEDSDKVIVINADGKAIYSMPTIFHQDVLQKLLKIVNACSKTEDPLLAQADIPLLIDKKKGKLKHPDISIWGPSRLDEDCDPRFIPVDGLPGENSMNPHVIIEFSWTNDLQTEIWKLKKQMTDHIQDLGVVKLGFLIKAIPAKGTAFPTVLDRNAPLAGFDVYRFRAGDPATSVPEETYLEYRAGGDDEDAIAIEISAADLGRTNQEEALRVPLRAIRRVCEKRRLVFSAVALD
ncbi:expressed unknown protein [Seminavis robusta]|uniref:Restriction endonuclease domain-containing protein n=1 Tax=Seminavis robusta TaxID=568900 RepID=A0A9N8DML9_9STRA|nr:expressed unknown protein [Seminavis robusta]|eukprot:Sro139_g065090.1 n/a (325) ;mRNA; r:51245-52219